MLADETAPLLNGLNGEFTQEDDRTYPPAHETQHRTLILLFDGTGDTEDDDVSNVVALKNLLYKDDPEKQLIFYQTGIGTYHPHFPFLKSVKIPFVSTASRTVDGAVAWSLKYHVIEAYEWILDNYQANDKICMFGFSRGAYTARALSGMISKIGLLPQWRRDQASDAYYCYKKTGNYTKADLAAFRKENETREVTIEFLGVWDTVGSVGIVTAKKLPFTNRNKSVKTFRHAVALDERRARFRSNMWNPPKQNPKKQPKPYVTDVDQVWFIGAHCDVGGGSVLNNTRRNLAHIALRWMVRECFKAKSGIMFKPYAIAKIGMDPDTLYPIVKPRPPPIEPTPDMKISCDRQPSAIKRFGLWLKSFIVDTPTQQHGDDYSEEEYDLHDALAPIYDQLSLKWAKWCLLEILPLKAKNWRPNLGRGRTILPPIDPTLTDPAKAAAMGKVAVDPSWAKLRVHRTVRTRMACAGDKNNRRYVPQALMNGEITLDKVDPALIEWVD